jgi:uncharacterized membrane protein YdbT with pleckstrin-like domain
LLKKVGREYEELVKRLPMTTLPTSTLYGAKQQTLRTSTPEGFKLAVFYSGFSSTVVWSHIHANRSVVVVVVAVVVVVVVVAIIIIIIINHHHHHHRHLRHFSHFLFYLLTYLLTYSMEQSPS